ncbi:DNA/RNA non-specific endonuclease [Streptomyces sp. 372A]
MPSTTEGGRKADPDKDTEIVGGDTARGRGTDRTNPAGWQHLDGALGWARGHLVARQLGGNGRDRRNLVKMYNAANS